MAPGFKPVGWVAAVAGAAIGCYMLSLNVASERADLLRIERQIIATKQDIRTLQTELGTRGRLAQLETWNAEVLALSAPTTGQFLDNEVKLARFDRQAPTIDDKIEVQLASAEVAPTQPTRIEAPVLQAAAPAPAPAPVPAASPRPSLIHQASLTLPVRPALAAAALEAEAASEKQAKAVKVVRAAVPTKPAKAAAPAAKPASTASTTPSTSKPAKPVTLAANIAKTPKPAAVAASSIATKPKPTKPATGSRLDASLSRELGAAAKLETNRRNR
jgi:hypothetical protein